MQCCGTTRCTYTRGGSGGGEVKSGCREKTKNVVAASSPSRRRVGRAQQTGLYIHHRAKYNIRIHDTRADHITHYVLYTIQVYYNIILQRENRYYDDENASKKGKTEFAVVGLLNALRCALVFPSARPPPHPAPA